jgi:hypothetical protein
MPHRSPPYQGGTALAGGECSEPSITTTLDIVFNHGNSRRASEFRRRKAPPKLAFIVRARSARTINAKGARFEIMDPKNWTVLPVCKEHLYLGAIMDWYSRKVLQEPMIFTNRLKESGVKIKDPYKNNSFLFFKNARRSRTLSKKRNSSYFCKGPNMDGRGRDPLQNQFPKLGLQLKPGHC